MTAGEVCYLRLPCYHLLYVVFAGREGRSCAPENRDVNGKFRMIISPHSQRRSWPGRGSRGSDPPELPSGVHAKRKNPVRIFRTGGGVGG